MVCIVLAVCIAVVCIVVLEYAPCRKNPTMAFEIYLKTNPKNKTLSCLSPWQYDVTKALCPVLTVIIALPMITNTVISTKNFDKRKADNAILNTVKKTASTLCIQWTYRCHLASIASWQSLKASIARWHLFLHDMLKKHLKQY